MKNKPKRKTHTIIISDLHLGSKVSQPEKVLKLLKSFSFRKLILLGDIFDDLNLGDLSTQGLDLLDYIGKISRDKKLRWVIGNHDEGFYKIFAPLMNAKIYQSYHWQYKNRKYLTIHGHQFDRFLINNVVLSQMSSAIYRFIQRIDFQDKRFSHYIKNTSKGWLRISQKVARGAIREAEKHGAEYVFCGHTHKAIKKRSHDIKYFNSGCWTDNPCTFITVDEDKVEINRF